ncbi:MAG: aspartate 1-decarboxylase [Opitutus sp.]|nr:aspartate 1-decarboxylase [Opitutus sp.]
MLRTFLRTKIHRATVTKADVDYEGSISIDRALCRAAGLLEFEQVDVYDITNGERFTTYVIFGEPGQIQVNGAAANLVKVGDLVIIAAYATLEPQEIAQHRATVVLVGEKNALKSVAATVVREP